MKHEPCPKCREAGKDKTGDNLKIFPDGGKFCFACGFSVPSFKFPRDALGEVHSYISADLPDSARMELGKYLNSYEIEKHFRFDATLKRVVLRDTMPMFYWGKNSYMDPKVLTKGRIPFRPFLTSGTCNTLVIVEDPISAIKVSRVLDCVPMFGAYWQPHWYEALVRMSSYSSVIVWLDHDKAKEGLRLALSLKNLFYTGWIDTPRDPKCYSAIEISNFVAKTINKGAQCQNQPVTSGS
jgi:hypothetical protein